MKRNMIILLAREGQMCNQLTSLATLLSLGLEYSIDIKCPVIDQRNKEFFAFNSEDLPIDVKFTESKGSIFFIYFSKIINRVFKKIKEKKYNPQKPNRVQIFVNWLSFMDFRVLTNHLSEIRKYFAFNQSIERKCNGIINEIKQDKEEQLVGVHIRRGDYKEFNHGLWYYSDEEYSHWMIQLARDKDVQFIISSNEKVDLDMYHEQGIKVTQPGHSAIEDLCLLSKCDYIMGPPSTYSAWAAMIGNSRRCILRDGHKEYFWEDFMYIEEHMENGEKYQ